MKKTVKMTREKLHLDITYITVGNAIESLKEAEESLIKKGCSDILLYIETEQDEYSDGFYVSCYLMGSRPETVEEINKRKAQEEKFKGFRKQQYESLKKEFEGK